tara:strand:+ start:193 stop:411 length:219 start_codon:yes stop_codon:yes gene_type:complete
LTKLQRRWETIAENADNRWRAALDRPERKREFFSGLEPGDFAYLNMKYGPQSVNEYIAEMSKKESTDAMVGK